MSRSIRGCLVGTLLVAGLAVPAAAQAATPRPVLHAGAEQAYAVGLRPHARVRLVNGAGRTLRHARADAQGGVLFRGLRAGTRAGLVIAAGGRRSRLVHILSDRAAPRRPRTACTTSACTPATAT